MPRRNRFRTLADAQGHVDALSDLTHTTRPLAVLLRAAEATVVDPQTGQEMILLLQCITDLTHQFQLDTETTTTRFKAWAIGSARPWWLLYQAAMQGDQHAARMMYREVQ